jgi:hypothetical protein
MSNKTDIRFELSKRVDFRFQLPTVFATGIVLLYHIAVATSKR